MAGVNGMWLQNATIPERPPCSPPVSVLHRWKGFSITWNKNVARSFRHRVRNDRRAGCQGGPRRPGRPPAFSPLQPVGWPAAVAADRPALLADPAGIA